MNNVVAADIAAGAAAEVAPEYSGLARLLMKRRTQDKTSRRDPSFSHRRYSADFLLWPCHSEDRIWHLPAGVFDN